MTQYVLAQLEVHDIEAFKNYQALANAAEAKLGGASTTSGPNSVVLEGGIPGTSVLLKFPDRKAAMAWFDDPELADAHSLRNRASKSTIVLLNSF